MDLSGHIFLPKEDYYDLMAQSWSPKTASDRVMISLQSTILLASISSSVVLSTWGVLRAIDWLERRRAMRIASETTA